MNYKETLFFIAKCLTISLEDKNRQEIEKTVAWYLKNNEWMEKVTSGKYQEYYQKMYNK